MNDQVFIKALKQLQQVHRPSEEVLLRIKERVLMRAALLPPSSVSVKAKRGFASFISTHLIPHTFPLVGVVGLVLAIAAGTGFASLHATPRNAFLYRVASTVEETRIALYPSREERARQHVALLQRGVNDLTRLNLHLSSPAAIDAVLETVEGRFGKVAGRLQAASPEGPYYPLVLLVSTADSANETSSALSTLRTRTPVSLQPKLEEALVAVKSAKKAALAVLVTYTDKAKDDPEALKLITETIGKELNSVQDILNALAREGGDGMLEDAEKSIKSADRAFQGGDFKVTLSLINEADALLQSSQEGTRGAVQGDSTAADAEHAFSATTTPVNETTTDVMAGASNAAGSSAYSGNSGEQASTSKVRAMPKIEEVIEAQPREPEEFPVGFDL